MKSKNDLSEHEVGRFFIRIAKRYLGALTYELAHLNIERYYLVLLMIDQAEGPLSQKELAEEFNIDKTAIVRVMDYLTEKKMIQRVVNPVDRRAHKIVLTAQGKKALPHIRKAVTEVNKTLTKGMNGSQKELFFSLLAQARKNIEQIPSESYHFVLKQENAKKIKE